MLSQIVQMVAQAQRSKAPMQRMADQVAGWFVLVVIGIALTAFFAWGLLGGPQGWQYGLSRQDCDHLIPGPRLHIPKRAQHPVQRLVCTQSGD